MAPLLYRTSTAAIHQDHPNWTFSHRWLWLNSRIPQETNFSLQIQFLLHDAFFPFSGFASSSCIWICAMKLRLTLLCEQTLVSLELSSVLLNFFTIWSYIKKSPKISILKLGHWSRVFYSTVHHWIFEEIMNNCFIAIYHACYLTQAKSGFFVPQY